MTRHAERSRVVGDRKGITLLEVLIAGGILVIGLASVAAILPAAGLLLGEASMADRASALSSNAFAELSRRGTFKSLDFTGNVTTVVVGDMFMTPSGLGGGNRTAYPFPLSGNVTGNSTFVRKPSLTPATADRTAYGLAWFGATATPLQAKPLQLQPGMAARVAVIVSQSATPERDRVGLKAFPPPSPGNNTWVYEIDPGQGLAPAGVPLVTRFPSQSQASLRADIRKRLLAGCSWVAVVNEAVNAAIPIRWLRVANSWATYESDGVTIKGCYVSFVDDGGPQLPNILEVYAFQGILRVEERIIQLAE